MMTTTNSKAEAEAFTIEGGRKVPVRKELFFDICNTGISEVSEASNKLDFVQFL